MKLQSNLNPGIKAIILALVLMPLNNSVNKNDKQLKEPKKMITVKVTYGVKKEYAAKNKENIALFMKDFKAMKSNNFRYNVYVLEDDTTFVHISSYANEQIQQKVLSIPSFKEFQRQRDESGLTKAHHIEMLNKLASSHDDLQ